MEHLRSRGVHRSVHAAAALLLALSAVGLVACTEQLGPIPPDTHHTGSVHRTPSPTPTLGPAVDHGAIAHADGSATAAGAGHYVYTVASGDTVFAIAERFHVCIADLYGSNAGLAGHQSDLVVGQTLTIGRVKAPDHGADACLSGGNADTDY